MLDKNPLMIDIDVKQWANLHHVVLKGLREKRRIVVIHENGKVQNISHSHEAEVVNPIRKVTDPEMDAKKLFETNEKNVDLVMVLERSHVENYYNEVQSSWKVDEDLDEYMYRMYSLLDCYYPGIVAYPGPASRQFGLQWLLPGKVGYLQFKSVLESFADRGTAVVIAVFENKTELWTSLVLGVDEKGKISLITSVKQGIVKKDWREEYQDINRWVDENYWKSGLAIYMDKKDFLEISSSKAPSYLFKGLCDKGSIIIDPSTESLKAFVAKYRLHELS